MLRLVAVLGHYGVSLDENEIRPDDLSVKALACGLEQSDAVVLVVWPESMGRAGHRNRGRKGGGARRGGAPPRPQAGGRGQVVAGRSCMVTRDRESAGRCYVAVRLFLLVTRDRESALAEGRGRTGTDPAETADAGRSPRGKHVGGERRPSPRGTSGTS